MKSWGKCKIIQLSFTIFLSFFTIFTIQSKNVSADVQREEAYYTDSETVIGREMIVTTGGYPVFNQISNNVMVNEVLTSSELLGKKVDVIAQKVLANQTIAYKYEFADETYWTDSRAFSQNVEIIKQELHSQTMRVVNPNYGGYNVPGGLVNAKLLLSGNDIQNKVIQVIATYTLSNGEQYCNYKYGSRYYWTNIKALIIEPIITRKQSIKKNITMNSQNYGSYNIPATLFAAKELLSNGTLYGKKVKAIAKYTVNDGTSYYNYKYGNRYYWTDVRAFTDVPTVIKRKYLSRHVRFITNSYGAYNTPADLVNSKLLKSGSQLYNQVVDIIALNELSNGARYYNYKYGNRYYWTNEKAFQDENVIVQKESCNIPLKISSSAFTATNIPSSLFAAQHLLGGEALLNQVVTVIAKYTVSDGSSFYNFKYGARYYWLNTKAFTKIAYITKREKMSLKVKIISNVYRAFNTPSPLENSKLLLAGDQLKNQTVKVIARYRVNNGEWYYNFKLGNRYYWVNSRAFAEFGEVLLNTPIYINQYQQGVPNGCEAASLFMALKASNHINNYSFNQFLKTMPIAKNLNPYQGFGGSLYNNQTGFPAIFLNPLIKWGSYYGKITNLNGKSAVEIKRHLNQLHPVVAFVTIHFKNPLFSKYWWGSAVDNNHAVLVDGYRDGAYHVSDPIDGQYWVTSKMFESVYNSRKWGLAIVN